MFNESVVDVRLSLKTGNRTEARNRGAVLTASTKRVVEMLNERARAGEPIPTEGELQAIAKAMYEELLAKICADQRATPYHSDLHSAANNGYIDYFQRLTGLGGHLSFLPAEGQRLEAQGWDAQRIADLRYIIRLREEMGLSPIKREDIDRHLERAGFRPDDQLRWLVELALYPTYRDAHIEAEAQLQSLLGPGATRVRATNISTAMSAPATIPTTPRNVIASEEWLSYTPTQVAERMIAETPNLLEHRSKGKRAREAVGEQTHRQIRWASTLLEKSLPPETPLWKVTKADIVRLDSWFDLLPVTFGKSPRDRASSVTLEGAAGAAVEKVDQGDLDAGDIGLSTGTTNKHFNKLGQIHKFMLDHVDGVSAIDFSAFTQPIDKNEREARLRYTREQGQAIFSLPPWTGCEGPTDRLQPGKHVIHDGLFFVLLLVWYTGARREELCKLMLEDVEERHGISYLLIRPTITGRVKNKSARRVVVLAEELIRLGFLRYFEAMRAAGETLLFPELLPAPGTKRKLGDVFYKNWWIYIKPLVPDLKRGQAMHAARHMVADEMKDQEVFIEYRNDHLGHKGSGEGMTRYPSPTSLARLRETVAKIPVVTEHLVSQEAIHLLPSGMRTPRPSRGRKDDASGES
ncbi:MAG: hypothetical protein EOP62_00390 [Sphingomonadales bacterium]|nr:MAG: hypothetical protein EOP62_00390 [Sphingomonadales bacterium]